VGASNCWKASQSRQVLAIEPVRHPTVAPAESANPHASATMRLVERIEHTEQPTDQLDRDAKACGRDIIGSLSRPTLM